MAFVRLSTSFCAIKLLVLLVIVCTVSTSSLIFRLVSTLLVAKYIHNFGRKTMYFISAATTILFQVLFGVIDILGLGYTWKICPLIVICGQVTFKKLGGVQYVKSQLSTEHTAKLSVMEVVRIPNTKTKLIFLSVQVFCLQLGIQTIPYLLSSELFPNDARARCKGLIRAISAIFSFSMLKVFPYLEDFFGLYGSFWGFASILFLILPIVFICVPEAKDVDLNHVAGEHEVAIIKSQDNVNNRGF